MKGGEQADESSVPKEKLELRHLEANRSIHTTCCTPFKFLETAEFQPQCSAFHGKLNSRQH